MYKIKDLETIRKKINQEFIIQLSFRKEKKRELVGFTKFCQTVGNLHAEHYSKKALTSKKRAPRFRGFSGTLIVTFFPR